MSFNHYHIQNHLTDKPDTSLHLTGLCRAAAHGMRGFSGQLMAFWAECSVLLIATTLVNK